MEVRKRKTDSGWKGSTQVHFDFVCTLIYAIEMQSDKRYLAATESHKLHIGIIIPSPNPFSKTHI